MNNLNTIPPNYIIAILIIIGLTAITLTYIIKDSNIETKIKIKELLSIEIKSSKQLPP